MISHEFYSDTSELEKLPRVLEEFRMKCRVSDDQFYNLVVAMTEAVANAIVHGNKSDSGKRVRYSLECRQEGIFCAVEDEGEGFDLDKVDDPILPENILREGGRGMFLIRALMKDLQVERTDTGSRVEFLCVRT